MNQMARMMAVVVNVNEEQLMFLKAGRYEVKVLFEACNLQYDQ